MPRFPDCWVEGTNTIILRLIALSPPWIASSTLGETMGDVYMAMFRDHVHTAAMTARCSEDMFLGQQSRTKSVTCCLARGTPRKGR